MPEVSAADALDARQRDPHAAIEMGRSALRRARAAGDAEEASLAERAIGLSYRELHDFDAAERHLRRSIRIARKADSARLTALARMSLAFVLSNTGRHVQALRAITAALPDLHGQDAGSGRTTRGSVLHFLCRYDEALREYNAAVEVVRRFDDRLTEARVLNNRGLLRAYTGGLRAADEDFDRAALLYRELGQDLAVADVRWNAGISAVRAGDIPRALTMFAEAEQEYRRLEVPRPLLLINRLELLVSVPLVEEARAAADRALAEMCGRNLVLGRSEALFYRARIALLEGDLDQAVETAALARKGFRRERREVWEASARHVELHAAYLSGQRSRALGTAMAKVADRLDELGWRMPGLEARVDAALIARDLGNTAVARKHLETAGAARRGGTAANRAQGWYAEALRRDLDGNPRGAQTALRRGLALLDEYRVSLGAAELRALSGAQGKALALAGLRGAIATGHAAKVLTWAESWRAGALRMTPARPPEDSAVADALAELRAVTADLEGALLAGKASGALRQRQVRMEQRVRDLSRQVSGGGAVHRPPAVRDLAWALGDAALVEYLNVDDELLAVVVAGGRASLHRLGDVEGAVREIRLLRFALHRMVTLPASVDRAHLRGTSAHAAGLLADRLLGPLRGRIDGRALVLAPTGVLNGLPWSVLPGNEGRSVTVAPSATVWLRAATSSRVPRPADRSVLAAGPRLPAAPTEIAAVAAHVPGARQLVGSAATVDAVAAAMDGAPLAHVAAHGSFRADNPLFSALELADGPLTVYDLERLRTPPARVVLSACDSGMSAVRPGDELMGFTAALLGLGTATLIAPVMPVPTEMTTPLMVDLHRRLGEGVSPAVALAQAQRDHSANGDDMAYSASVGFVCFGAG